MKVKFGAALALLAFSLVFLFPAFAQDQQGAGTPGSMKDELTKQYKPVKLGSNAGSTTVTDTGTVLVVQQAGLLGVPPNSYVPCPAHFKDGSLHAPSIICKAALRNTGKDFANGDKVYPMKFDINMQKEEVSMTVLECDTCNNTDPPTYFHAIPAPAITIPSSKASSNRVRTRARHREGSSNSSSPRNLLHPLLAFSLVKRPTRLSLPSVSPTKSSPSAPNRSTFTKTSKSPS
jgi:hypothetical protein